MQLTANKNEAIRKLQKIPQNYPLYSNGNTDSRLTFSEDGFAIQNVRFLNSVYSFRNERVTASHSEWRLRSLRAKSFFPPRIGQRRSNDGLNDYLESIKLRYLFAYNLTKQLSSIMDDGEMSSLIYLFTY